jgi:hypothetical protein
MPLRKQDDSDFEQKPISLCKFRAVEINDGFYGTTPLIKRTHRVGPRPNGERLLAYGENA